MKTNFTFIIEKVNKHWEWEKHTEHPTLDDAKKELNERLKKKGTFRLIQKITHLQVLGKGHANGGWQHSHFYDTIEKKDMKMTNLLTYTVAKNAELKKWWILEKAIHALSDKNSNAATKGLCDIQQVTAPEAHDTYDQRFVIAQAQADAADHLVEILDTLAGETDNNTRVIRALKTAKIYAHITKKVRDSAKVLAI